MSHCRPHSRAAAAAPFPDSERTACEVWSRVMGYHRPVAFWNAGKQQEHRDRVQFNERRVHA